MGRVCWCAPSPWASPPRASPCGLASLARVPLTLREGGLVHTPLALLAPLSWDERGRCGYRLLRVAWMVFWMSWWVWAREMNQAS